MDNEQKKAKVKENPHFAKVIEYADEPWRTDITFGQKGSKSHGHLALSGSSIYFLRDEQDNEIIIDGVIDLEEVKKKKLVK